MLEYIRKIIADTQPIKEVGRVKKYLFIPGDAKEEAMKGDTTE